MNPRPLLSAERKAIRRLKLELRVEAFKAKEDVIVGQLSATSREKEELVKAKQQLRDMLLRKADHSRHQASTMAAWLISSALAANLAGIWAVISQKGMDRPSLYFALICFSIGALFAYQAGSRQGRISSVNADRTTMYLIWLIDRSDSEESPPKPKLPSGDSGSLVGDLWFSLSPIAFFVIGGFITAHSVLHGSGVANLAHQCP
jgi:hypothetical protein